jgi:glycosyltransferase involved in cell wall biosynthesis
LKEKRLLDITLPSEKEKILVIIPAFNEEENIARVIDELKSDMPQLDLLVVDDGSTDRTAELVRHTLVPCLSLPFNIGYSGALQAGYKYAVTHDYNIVVQFDGDGQHIAGEIGKLLDVQREAGADIVIGSRFIGSCGYRHSCARMFGTLLFRYLITSICGVTIHDPTSGFQLIKRRAFERYSRMHNFPYFPDANIIIEMLLHDFKIAEVQVTMRQRQFGQSMHSGLLNPFIYMIKVMFSIFIIIIKYFPARLAQK